MKYVVALPFVSLAVMLLGFMERFHLGTSYLLFGGSIVLVACMIVVLVGIAVVVIRDGL